MFSERISEPTHDQSGSSLYATFILYGFDSICFGDGSTCSCCQSSDGIESASQYQKDSDDKTQKKVEFVTIQKGTLPVILSAPHGGELDLPGSLPRDRKSGGSRFQTVRDVRSIELAEAIANQLEAEFGQRPYVVILRVSRKYLDANREADYAYESPEAQVVYDEYHGAIEQFKKAILEKHGSGLLIDVHGQSKEKGAVYRGTRNGLTISALNRRLGKDAAALYSKVMEDAGLRMIPPRQPLPIRKSSTMGERLSWRMAARILVVSTAFRWSLERICVPLRLCHRLRKISLKGSALS